MALVFFLSFIYAVFFQRAPMFNDYFNGLCCGIYVTLMVATIFGALFHSWLVDFARPLPVIKQPQRS